MLSAAWLAGVLLGLSSGLATAALLLAGAAGLVAVGLRLARLPAFPALLAAVLLLGLAWAPRHLRPQAPRPTLWPDAKSPPWAGSPTTLKARQREFDSNFRFPKSC